ncbi:hypothetical protein bcgnr5371_60270 [Bacillus cereus]
MMQPNKRGFYDAKTVLESGLPIVDFEQDENCYCEMTWFSYTDMKKILEIHLTDYERKNCIVAFYKMRNGHGYTPLYSFLEILNRRDGKEN